MLQCVGYMYDGIRNLDDFIDPGNLYGIFLFGHAETHQLQFIAVALLCVVLMPDRSRGLGTMRCRDGHGGKFAGHQPGKVKHHHHGISPRIPENAGQQFAVHRTANILHAVNPVGFHTDDTGNPIHHKAHGLAVVNDNGPGGIVMGLIVQSEDAAQGDNGQHLTAQAGQSVQTVGGQGNPHHGGHPDDFLHRCHVHRKYFLAHHEGHKLTGSGEKVSRALLRSRGDFPGSLIHRNLRGTPCPSGQGGIARDAWRHPVPATSGVAAILGCFENSGT